MNGDLEIVGRFVGDFGGPAPADPVPDEAELVRPARTIVFDDVAVPYPVRTRGFVVHFRPETNLPPVAVRGTGVDLMGPAYGIWVGDPGAKTFVSVFRVEDVARIVLDQGGAHPTAS